MYIKNQQFKDEDTLFEVLFDFEIGEASPYMQAIADRIANALDADKVFTAHLQALAEEDALEFYDDLKREKIVNQLQQNFSSFVVENARFYGVSGHEKCLLYTIDLY